MDTEKANMDTEKLKAGFDLRPIPQLLIRSNDNKPLRNPYAKRYMTNKINVVINDEVTKKMRDIKNKRNFKSDSDTIKYLCDLETAIDPKMKITYKCKTCNEYINDVPKSININRFLHNDLCKTTPCKGFIITSKEIALDEKGFVISNKGATTTNDESSGTTDKKDQPEQREQTLEEKYAELEENTREFERKRELEHQKKFN